MRDANHPITHGLPAMWMHQGDELYALLRGPGRNMTVLATAHSDPSNNGTGRDEPQLMVLSYGKGRVFHTTMGHDISALSSVDFVVTFQRGTEWAATGAVTQPIPADFPTADTVSVRADLAAIDQPPAPRAAALNRRPRRPAAAAARRARHRCRRRRRRRRRRIRRSRCAPVSRSFQRSAASATAATRWAARPDPI